MRVLPSRRAIYPLALVVAALAVLATGCGGSGGHRTATTAAVAGTPHSSAACKLGEKRCG